MVRVRKPTHGEYALVGRDAKDGDCVVKTIPDPEAQADLARVFESLGMCDIAHVIPAGVYLQE